VVVIDVPKATFCQAFWIVVDTVTPVMRICGLHVGSTQPVIEPPQIMAFVRAAPPLALEPPICNAVNGELELLLAELNTAQVWASQFPLAAMSPFML
jgi:hypothetical protein